MSLNHRMNSKADGSTSTLLPIFLNYRGVMIRSLMNEISSGPDDAAARIVAGMLTLLLVDVSPHTCRFAVPC